MPTTSTRRDGLVADLRAMDPTGRTVWVEPDGDRLDVPCQDDYDHGSAVVSVAALGATFELCGDCAVRFVGRLDWHDDCEVYVSPEPAYVRPELGDVIKCQRCGQQSRSISRGCSACGWRVPQAARS